MRILISGSTGLVGTALIGVFNRDDHEVFRLVRTKPGDREIGWDPTAGKLDEKSLDDFDVVIHLAGEGIASGRWTAAKKTRIRESRVKGTRLLCEALARSTSPPGTLLTASAVGFYGDRAEERLNEESPAGSSFLAEVCEAWEKATAPAVEKGIRVAHLRFGVILSASGGALNRMLTPFRLGVGGRIGNGRQYMSWITIDDAVAAIQHLLNNSQIAGAINVVAPNALTNNEFTSIVGRVLRRPTLFPFPAFAARIVLGEMADALLLHSARVEPAKLLASGFNFRYPDMESALRHLLGKKKD